MTTEIRKKSYIRIWSKQHVSPITSVVSRLSLPVVSNPVMITFLSKQSIKIEKKHG
ncbi:hypothetical protein PGB90_006517 [Kerria lacca]